MSAMCSRARVLDHSYTVDRNIRHQNLHIAQSFVGRLDDEPGPDSARVAVAVAAAAAVDSLFGLVVRFLPIQPIFPDLKPLKTICSVDPVDPSGAHAPCSSSPADMAVTCMLRIDLML